jgi:hypothetical protein
MSCSRELKPTGQDTKITNQFRMKWINANMAVVARVVVDTMYRGAGLAQRFTNIASRMEGKRFIEIQSSMSKYNLFAHKAGFQFVKPMRSNKYDVGIKFFRSTFVSDPADLEAILEEWTSKPPVEREAILAATKEFYYKHSALEKTGKSLGGVGEARVAKMSMRDCLHALQQMVLASPSLRHLHEPGCRPEGFAGTDPADLVRSAAGERAAGDLSISLRQAPRMLRHGQAARHAEGPRPPQPGWNAEGHLPADRRVRAGHHPGIHDLQPPASRRAQADRGSREDEAPQPDDADLRLHPGGPQPHSSRRAPRFSAVIYPLARIRGRARVSTRAHAYPCGHLRSPITRDSK